MAISRIREHHETDPVFWERKLYKVLPTYRVWCASVAFWRYSPSDQMSGKVGTPDEAWRAFRDRWLRDSNGFPINLAADLDDDVMEIECKRIGLPWKRMAADQVHQHR